MLMMVPLRWPLLMPPLPLPLPMALPLALALKLGRGLAQQWLEGTRTSLEQRPHTTYASLAIADTTLEPHSGIAQYYGNLHPSTYRPSPAHHSHLTRGASNRHCNNTQTPFGQHNATTTPTTHKRNTQATMHRANTKSQSLARSLASSPGRSPTTTPARNNSNHNRGRRRCGVARMCVRREQPAGLAGRRCTAGVHSANDAPHVARCTHA